MSKELYDPPPLQNKLQKRKIQITLIDKDGNVYSNNQISPKIVGRKNDQTGMIEPISLDILEHYK